ncbi:MULTISPECIES: site-2 protease family protein [unclassified Peribacillus]|uniref:site-2 protease family protein n=1 Tax=unclassified Peribacillus TaxID=2675266 RepID=UPI001913B172|nr:MULTISPECIES: site-2 protease family protein [unclassified Peribacillus]MBK5446381.1 site-2 protease family protein [Peribacillus sp. TH24]MBK5458909.1 site-2 protease family protein [Peribacillus sp. TH27]
MKESKSNKGWLSLGAIGLFFLGKMKWLFALLKIAKVGSLISIFVSLGAYALVYGWKFAVALVYLIYIHEMGHLLAAKRKGIKTSNAIFIPFVGALIALKEEPKNANQEAYLAFGGPLLGTLAFLPAIPLFMMTENPFWLLVITLGAMINLFNLMPVHPLDGGRIVGVISTKLWVLGIIGMVVYLFLHPNPFLILFLLLGISKWWKEFRSEITRNQRDSVIEFNQFGLEQLEEYAGATEEEKIRLFNIWNVELNQLSQKLNKTKTWHIPLLEDNKLKERQLNELKENIYNSLVDAANSNEYQYGPTDFGNIGTYERIVATFFKEVQEQTEIRDKEKSYYSSSLKTKVIWFSLYIGLAIFLMITSLYAGDLMEQYKTLLP